MGFVAILDTSGSTASHQGVLTAYRADGTTVLQSDAGSWLNGSVIAWQFHVNGNAPYYLRVGDAGDDQPITAYRLRYYPLAVSLEPEVEPNSTPASANTASKTNVGAIGTAGDADCFAFWGLSGARYSIVLNADPEHDGSSTNFALSLYAPDGALLRQADSAGAGHNELIDAVTPAMTGVYTCCARASAGSTGAAATYLAGIIANDYNYFPPTPDRGVWSDRRPGGFARVGDLLRFTLAVTNASPLPIPGPVSAHAYPVPACMDLASAPGASTASSSYVVWNKVGLAPYEVFSVNFAVSMRSPSVTADLRFFNALRDTPWAPYCLWVQDIV